MKSKNFFLKRLVSYAVNEKTYNKIKSFKIIWDIKRKKDHDFINELISKLIPHDSLIIDVGANMGQCTGRFSKAFRNGKIYSLEPIEENFIAIKRMIKKLDLKNVQVFHLGISESEGECEISIPVLKGVTVSTQASLEKSASFSDKGVKVRKEKILTERLGSFIRRNNIRNIDLIKIDTEGHDYKVLVSGKEDILKTRPIIKMENNWNSPEISWLYDNNYEPFRIKNKKLYNSKNHLELKGDSVLIPKELLSKVGNYIVE